MKPIRIFVRLGALKRFHVLKRRTADLNVEVTWDRRRSDRRTDASDPVAKDQRQIDRRQKPPYTWDVADFVVVEEPPSANKREG